MSVRIAVALVLVALALATSGTAAAAPPPPPVIQVDPERFEILAEGNSLSGVRRAPVPYSSASVIAAAVGGGEPVAAVVRVTRAAPPQVIDYVFAVTEDGVLVVGRQVRTLDLATGRYVFTEGDIKRAYQALEATVPWMWIVDIPLGREIGVSLELQAMSARWPIRVVFVTPKVLR